MFNAELELLECRLTELYDAVDAFVLVESHVDHQDHAKPLHYDENQDRFKPWADKIVHVIADELPTLEEDDGPWARENAQREWIVKGLKALDARDDDVVLQSDVDEIPTAVAARNVKPSGTQFVSFSQRGHFWAIDWYWGEWQGTVAARLGAIGLFSQMRDRRNLSPVRLARAGWHFSWLGTADDALAKTHSFCHPEVEPRIRANAVESDRYRREGIHVDGRKMQPVEVDKTWPKWMQEPANVPQSWYRPR